MGFNCSMSGRASTLNAFNKRSCFWIYWCIQWLVTMECDWFLPLDPVNHIPLLFNRSVSGRASGCIHSLDLTVGQLLDFILNNAVDFLVLKVKANHVRVLLSAWMRSWNTLITKFRHWFSKSKIFIYYCIKISIHNLFLFRLNNSNFK